MRQFNKPTVIVSKCLEFEPCRYNGAFIPDGFVKRLAPHVTFVPVCPEVEIGLGVPREPIRIISIKDEPRLIQPATGRDLSDEMLAFSDHFLGSLKEVDGFILKSRSPSCGIKDVKAYLGPQKGAAAKPASGFFAGKVVSMFPGLAIEDEGRLNNFTIREHFLTKLFVLADFRAVKRSRSMGQLVRFHTINKFLLMAAHQKEMRLLGLIVANPERKPARDVMADYERHLKNALARPAKAPSNINVLMHGLGYFSERLTAREKAYFLDTLEKYRAKKVPLSAVLGILKAWIVRFENGYLDGQTFFEPYPEELVEVTDSGKGRDV